MELNEKVKNGLNTPEHYRLWSMAKEPPREDLEHPTACGPPPGGYRSADYSKGG